MKNISQKRSVKVIASFFITIMLWDVIFPAAAFALTGGPSQPEVQSFEPVGTTEMVDLFSGDFVYNIPLLDVEGFPINISYHSGVGMDDEASWVGLGWNINPGVINRNMRGIPDDFQGDLVKSTTNIKENKTWGVSFTPDIEIFGNSKANKEITKLNKDNKSDSALNPFSNAFHIGMTLGIFYNNYRGLGAEFGLNPTFKSGEKSKSKFALGLGLDFNANSQEGADISSRVSFGHDLKILKEGFYPNLSFNSSVNSRNGLQSLTFGYQFYKNNKGTYNYNRNGNFSLNPTSYTPQIDNELKNISINLSFHSGAETYGIFWKYGISGYFQSQFLKSRVRYNNAYGYLYSHDALDGTNPGGNIMYDLNRENDGVYTKGKPYLPMPVYTYDLFSVSGEGTGGLIRPFRSDVGVMTDATTKSTTVGIGLGVGFGVGNASKWDGDLSGNYGYNISGMWRYNDGNDFDIVKHLNFNKPSSASSFEPTYFRRTGEMTKANNDVYNELQYNFPVRIEVEDKTSGRLTSRLVTSGGGTKDIQRKVKQSTRQARNMLVSMLDNNEASKIALNRYIGVYPHNVFEMRQKNIKTDSVVPRETLGKFATKMSELTVVNEDGRRYVYDLPAYNNFQYDAAFRVVNVDNPGSLQQDRSTGLVKYNAGDNSTGNGRGEDNFYTKNELPAYAHSFFLTSILSPDYVDITGNGITDDDIGTAVKINYTKVYNDYRWRTPFGKTDHEANYDEGLKSDKYDDKANYIYGEKEIWYTHSIESKNYVACFYTSPRNDGHGVLNEDGGIDTSKHFYKLDSIKLFTKKELEINGGGATPLKTVHFEYDYTLCLNAQNNKSYDPNSSSLQEGTGKLTLKKIYFTYGNSRKGRTNSYQFEYLKFNPSYNIRGYDRWGNYKPNPTNTQMGYLTDSGSRLSNVDNPYVLQNKDSADLYASAWSLTSIKLPSGGKININYESDDYAYIQDKQAGQMFKIVGINSSNVFSNQAPSLYAEKLNKNFIFFDLVEPISKSAPSEVLERKKNDYVGGNEKIYFKFLVGLRRGVDYEYVSGYVDKLQMGFQSRNPSDSVYDVGYIELKEVLLQKSGYDKINPISKAAWNFMRLYAPKKLARIFSNYEPPPGSTKGVMSSLVGAISEVGTMISGFGARMREKEAGKDFVFNKSFIRLNNPNKVKYGGGVRVKKVSLSDDWENMVSGQESSTYGQNYYYTKKEKQADGSEIEISSGVATWEPSIGGDENSHKQPAEYLKSNTLAPDDQYMVELPIGESLYPAPGIGYSQVTTVNIKPSENIKRTATGKVINEFYTAKDFPVITSSTEVDNKPKHNRPSFLAQLLKVHIKDKAFVSQGYSVELNDMHGKPKAQWVYEEDNEVPISGVKYHYNYKINESGKNQLVSKVDVVNPNGSISSAEIGRENDYMFDMRNSYSYHAGATAHINVDGFFTSIFPIIVPSIFSSISIQELEFGSAVNTKVITRYGILKETEVFENGATVKTQNVLFDSETGNVLLAKTTNEFNDTIYTFNYPAHFAYEGMGQAYKNIGYVFEDVELVHGELQNLTNYTDFIFPGDELFLETDSASIKSIYGIKLWAVQSPNYPDELVFLTRTGIPHYTNSSGGEKHRLKIVRSGRRNMQGTSIGSVVSLSNPVVNGTLSFDSVINSGAVEFSEDWSVEDKSPFPFVKPDNPACSDSCLRELETLLFPVVFDLAPGDTIRLTEYPYSAYYSCVLQQPIGCRGDYTVWDSILVYGSTISLSGSTVSVGSQQDFKFASLNSNASITTKTHTPISKLLNNNLIINNNSNGFPSSPFHGENSVLSNMQQTTDCDMCGYILNPSSTDSVRLFTNAAGCIREFRKVCTELDDDCGINRVTPINCVDPKTGITKTIEGMTLPSMHPKSTCDDYVMFIYKKFHSCGGGAIRGGGGGPGICGTTDYDIFHVPRIINPYIYGTKGNWRPKRNWLFYNKRNQAATTNIRKDGTYTNYVDFWKKPMVGNQWDTGSSISSKWVWNTEVTKFNRTGNEIENKDALDIYSSALFGYGQSMVKAVANNSKLRQIAFDGFEDYAYYTNEFEDHFSFPGYGLTDTVSHTGKKSLVLNPNQQASNVFYTFYSESEPNTSLFDTSFNFVLLQPNQVIEHFSPDTGKYIISLWVKENVETPPYDGYKDTIIVRAYEHTCADTYKFIANGPIVEGWQKIEGIFNVGSSKTAIQITLKSFNHTAYFDDIRIHPWNSNMKSFVYHPTTLRLMAELDENNFATFYEYDDEGRLIRIKRETERGIITLQESRTGLKINE